MAKTKTRPQAVKPPLQEAEPVDAQDVLPPAEEAAPEPAAKAHVPEKEDPDAPIYVRATRVGHYDLTRHYPAGYDHPRAGRVFVLRSREGISKAKGKARPVHITALQQFSPNWMERVPQEVGRAAVANQDRTPKKAAVITKAAADRVVI